MTDEPGEIDELLAQHRRSNAIYEESLLGLEYWEYAWVNPGDLAVHGADRWRVITPISWWEEKILMERKPLANDELLRGMTEA